MQASDLKVGDTVKVTDDFLSRDAFLAMNLKVNYGINRGPYLGEFDGAYFDIEFPGFSKGHGGNGGVDKRDGSHWFIGAEDLLPFKKRRPSIASDVNLKPQTKLVLRHLEREDHISPMQALVVYTISRLAPCIHDLREAGYVIKTVQKRDAQGHKYAQYSLTK